MTKKLGLTILTPYGKYLRTEADSITVVSPLSTLGILPNHTPLVTTIVVCKLVVVVNGTKMIYAISGGLMNIKKDSEVTLLVDSIESKDEIDIARAENAKLRAETHLANEGDDITRAKAALSRALNRISVYNSEK